MKVPVSQIAAVCVLSLVLAAPVGATEALAPTPKSAPRTPVAKQALQERQPAVPASRVLEGQAVALDSEKIRLGGLDLRLFGIVPPQLSASFGPQARAALDRLTQTAVHCQIRDRAADGRLLATCANAANVDLAHELLRQGLAVSARGSLIQTELAAPYAAAEQAAQAQKIGLWSGVQAQPAPLPPVKPAVVEAAPKEKEKETPLAIAPVAASSLAPAVIDSGTDKKNEAAVTATAASIIAANPEALALATLQTANEAGEAAPQASWFERFQLLVTGLLMLGTALSIMGVYVWQKRQDRREDLRALAAALRGELMAARAVCLARFQQMANGTEDVNGSGWPRIRAMVFQAHVGRIGWLGAELARQVSSIYGLASDYAAFYQGPAGDLNRAETMSKKQALQKLISHIDTVMPRLATLESRKPWLGKLPLFSLSHLPSVPKLREALTQATTAPLSLPAHEPDPHKPDGVKRKSDAPTTSAAASEITDMPRPNAPEGETAQENAPVPMDAPVDAPEEMNEAAPVSEEKPETAPVAEADDEAPKVSAPETSETPASADEEKTEEAAPQNVEAKEELSAAPKAESEPAVMPEAPVVLDSKKKMKAARFQEAKAAKEATPVGPIQSRTTIAWERMRQIKETIQEKLVPQPVPVSTEHEEYLAMLNAEAEAFASYEYSESQTRRSKNKSRAS